LATQNWGQRAYDSKGAPTMEPRQRAGVLAAWMGSRQFGKEVSRIGTFRVARHSFCAVSPNDQIGVSTCNSILRGLSALCWGNNNHTKRTAAAANNLERSCNHDGTPRR